MAYRKIITLLATVSLVLSLTNGEVQLITKPEPGQEYVFLQTSAAGSRPVERKEKPSANERIFETAHKLPPSLTFALKQAEAEEGEIPTEPKGPVKTVNKVGKPKREALPADAPIPAPAGAIKLDVQALLAKYKTELKTSTTTTAKPSATTSTRNTRKPRGNPITGNKRTKKEASNESPVATTASSVLTTSAAGLKPVESDDDVPLIASGSEKQRSRIQIKKGPNGQEYEYEYVYYYYDDEDDKKSTKQSNAHDGPARNEITPQTPSRGRGSDKSVTPEPSSNEVVLTSRGRNRGRQLEDEDISDERLPANTRFPPRSRNFNTTPSSSEDAVEEVKPRGRGRGRPDAQPASTSAEANSDSVSDETQGSRGRTRANVRRPSLELVDSASFNTHTSSGEPPNGSGPTFPADLPAGPVRFLGATPNERMDLTDKKELSAEIEAVSVPAQPTSADETTTMMSAMDKVALDLYAILQGTQRLSGEEAESITELSTEADAETTTLEATTEIATTEALTTTTTTTTTTTPAPTTAALEATFGRGKYRNRPAIGGRKSAATTTTTEVPATSDGKPKSRFNRPSFGSRPRSKPVAAETEIEPKETKEEAKLVGGTRTRSRFGAARTRVTTAAPESTSETKAPAPTKASLRPRPTFNLRGRTRPTPAPESDASSSEESQEASTTARSRPRLNAANIRPLRPGPRINLTGGRGRLGVTTAAPAETPAEVTPVVDETADKTAVEEEVKEPESTPAPDTNPLSRLRNRQRSPLQVRPAAPKAAASAPVQVRRANPLLSRRRPIGEASTTEAAAAPEAAATDAPADAEEGATEAAPSSTTTTTTEEPKGLNKLLAGRRRLALRQPGTVAA